MVAVVLTWFGQVPAQATAKPGPAHLRSQVEKLDADGGEVRGVAAKARAAPAPTAPATGAADPHPPLPPLRRDLGK